VLHASAATCAGDNVCVTHATKRPALPPNVAGSHRSSCTVLWHRQRHSRATRTRARATSRQHLCHYPLPPETAHGAHGGLHPSGARRPSVSVADLWHTACDACSTTRDRSQKGEEHRAWSESVARRQPRDLRRMRRAGKRRAGRFIPLSRLPVVEECLAGSMPRDAPARARAPRRLRRAVQAPCSS